MSDLNNPAPGQPQPADAPGLVSDFIQQASRLLRSELALAKKEMGQKASRAAAGIAMVLIGFLLVLAALDVLAAAAVAAIVAAGLPVSVASLIVAAVALTLAAVLFLVGKAWLNPKNLTPDRSIKNVRRDIETIKENVHV
ncbi:phage holin family protein [Roseobacter weihaiensis]|uniref:phage holin family protein n=1 Tax=Roseobacter weihaiensis TaxID=2763262 RepID=UPI001D0AF798|nr:phage holin family protein [Roseobacter sp. H9]